MVYEIPCHLHELGDKGILFLEISESRELKHLLQSIIAGGAVIME
jgi:hypothetical protein